MITIEEVTRQLRKSHVLLMVLSEKMGLDPDGTVVKVSVKGKDDSPIGQLVLGEVLEGSEAMLARVDAPKPEVADGA